MRGEISSMNVVTTTLPAAIEFVIEVERREEQVSRFARSHSARQPPRRNIWLQQVCSVAWLYW